MRTKRIILSVIFVVVFILASLATAWKDVMNGISDKGFPDDGANTSITAAKQKGVLVCAAEIVPMHADWHGHPVDFDSAWIERKVKTKPYLVWWKKVENLPGRYLVIRCKSDNDVLDKSEVWLCREGAGHGFASHGTNSFDDDLDEDDFNSGRYVIYIISDWHAPRTNPIIVSWKP